MTEEEKKLQQAASEETTATPQEKSRWDSYMDEFQQRNPDVDMADDEARHNRYLDERDADKAKLKQYDDDYSKVNEMMYQQPNSADFLDKLYGGATSKELAKSLIQTYGKTFKDAIDDPTEENLEAFAEAWDANAQKLKEDDEWKSQWQNNDEGSQQTIEQWAKDNDKTPEQVEAIKQKVINTMAELASGIMSSETLDMFDKAMNYDSSVAAAEAKGRTEGKTSQAKEKVRRSKGDGMPILGRTAQAPRAQQESNSADDIFAMAGSWNG